MSATSGPLISVLVPVYNMERHLFACLQSAAAQSLQDIEILCIDDASVDGSVEIIRQFQTKERRLRYVRHDRNLGEGAARNTGIEEARGKFIVHLDPDDLLPEHALERLWRVAETYGSQMVKGAYSTITDEGRFIAERLQTLNEPLFNANLHRSDFLRRVPASHCSYLYERSFLVENGLRYRTDMRVGLDLVALSAALVAAERVSVVPDVVYLYRQTNASATRGETKLEVALDGVKTKRLVSGTLARAGYREAATRILQKWDWQLRAFWVTLVAGRPDDAPMQLFSQFRGVIPPGLIPWTKNSPLAHRYLLASILLGHDDDAWQELQDLRWGKDFANSSDLRHKLSRILQLAPEDSEVMRMMSH